MFRIVNNPKQISSDCKNEHDIDQGIKSAQPYLAEESTVCIGMLAMKDKVWK